MLEEFISTVCVKKANISFEELWSLSIFIIHPSRLLQGYVRKA